ncbi:MAG: hypothetical protein PHE24_04865 [Patescibacteria group bacterium]|nr:hypothetical protein [Patescibacteria group bacterium]
MSLKLIGCADGDRQSVGRVVCLKNPLLGRGGAAAATGWVY